MMGMFGLHDVLKPGRGRIAGIMIRSSISAAAFPERYDGSGRGAAFRTSHGLHHDLGHVLRAGGRDILGGARTAAVSVVFFYRLPSRCSATQRAISIIYQIGLDADDDSFGGTRPRFPRPTQRIAWLRQLDLHRRAGAQTLPAPQHAAAGRSQSESSPAKSYPPTLMRNALCRRCRFHAAVVVLLLDASGDVVNDLYERFDAIVARDRAGEDQDDPRLLHGRLRPPKPDPDHLKRVLQARRSRCMPRRTGPGPAWSAPPCGSAWTPVNLPA